MNIFQRKIIKADLRANTNLLLAIWLLIIILPTLILKPISDKLLKESEDILETSAKIHLYDEISDFKYKANCCSYINSRMHSMNALTECNTPQEVETLVNNISDKLRAKISILMYYNPRTDYFDVYIKPDLTQEIKLMSKNMLKDYLINCDKEGENTDTNKTSRQKKALQLFIRNAGDLEFVSDNAFPVLSGKESLRKMVGYFKKASNTYNSTFLYFVSEHNIPLSLVMKNAAEQSMDKNYIRSFCKTKSITNFSRTEPILFKYISEKEHELSITALLSENLIQRSASNDSYYPFNIDNLSQNNIMLKVTAKGNVLVHPIRPMLQLLKPLLITFVLLSTIFLIRISLFGYTIKLPILGRVILCILAAVILPYSIFSVAAFYRKYFNDEHSKNEIQQFTQIQSETIKKTIEASVENVEASISDLRNNVSGFTEEETYKYLSDWLKSNPASIISFNYETDEFIIKKRTNDQLSPMGAEAKKACEIAFNCALNEEMVKEIKTPMDFSKRYFFDPTGIGKVLTMAGKIFNGQILNEPYSLYSVFPYFSSPLEGKNPVGTILIKLNNHRLLEHFVNLHPEIITSKTVGDYRIETAVLPVTENGELPPSDISLMSKNFSYQLIQRMANKILTEKSQKVWETATNHYSGKYINNINSIVICYAEKIQTQDSERQYLYWFIGYILATIIVLSLILRNIIVTPINLLKSSASKVANGDFSKKISYESGDEFEHLSNAFNGMTEVLQQKEKMSSYVSTEILNEVSINSEQNLQPGGERIFVSVLFCALKGPKELSLYEPYEVTSIISQLVDTADEISTKNNGQIDKLIEDTLMLVFRKKDKNENVTLNACYTALEIQKKLQQQLPDFKIKMGIASGEAISGKIGSRNGKLDYTVIGNPVNLAARLKVQAERALKTGIIICPYSIRMLQGKGRLNFIDRVAIKGRTNRTFPLYELEDIRN